MATDRNKIVQNYCLEDLKYMNPDQSEIWLAKHKVLKKNFTLKRVRFRGGSVELSKDTQRGCSKEQWDYNNLIRETNILKRLICQTCPKCHKMIKTSNNIYVVYDQFPHLSVKEYLARNNLSKQQKLTLMLQIAKTLNYFHNRAIILLYFSVQTLFIKEKNVIFFSDWSLARTVESQDKINPLYLVNNFEGISNELKQEGKYSYWSDLYCLGTVFQKILTSGLLQEQTSIDKKLEPMLKKLHNQHGSQRPRLEEILRNLQNYGADEGSSKGGSPISKQLNLTAVKSISNFKIKHALSTPENDQFTPSKLTTNNQFFSKYASFLEPTPKNSDYQCPSPGFSKSDKSVRSDSKKIIQNTPPVSSSRKIQSRKSFDLTHYSSMNYSRRKKQEEKVSIEQIAKIINKKRNLAYFLFDLSEFVIRMGMCLELGYILLKYSLLTLNTALDQWQKHDSNKNNEKQEMIALLISQKLKMGVILSFLRENISQFSEDQSVKRQFDQEGQISQRLLKQKILQFCKQMVVYCDQVLGQKNHQNKLVDCLFKTYMVLKKIEEGSYEKFWDKVYQKDFAYLSNQKYLKQQKNLGFRYLKSRIAQILRGK